MMPMAGITDSAFRQIVKKCGADIVYSEMVSASGLFFEAEKTIELVKFSRLEQPIIIQLFGKDPLHFRKAAFFITKNFKPDIIDINFGCPARKVLKGGGGALLMNDIKKAREIIKETLAGTNLPISIKIRAQVKNTDAISFLKKINDLPIAAVAIHGRSLNQGFSGEIDFEIIKKAVSLLKIPVIANGGIMTPENAKEMLEKTNAQGLGIARGALGNPFIFQEIKDFLKTGKYQKKSFEEMKKIILEHSRLAYKLKGRHGIVEMRKYLLWYVRGLKNARLLRQKLCQVKSLEEIEKIVNKII